MNFLQPLLLVALPLVSLPIVIHLINQRRYQTVRWAAMMFLLAATRMSRGYARLRQWLIMAARMAAIAGLIFAASRPLAQGWLGLAAGGRTDTTILVIDRSPSMEQEGAAAGGTKRETGLRRLKSALETVGSPKVVIIDGDGTKPIAIELSKALAAITEIGPTSASSDMPAMLQSAHDYIKANQAGRTDIWICSDVRANDWNPSDARWQAIHEGYQAFPNTVRFLLVAYAAPAPENLSVRVSEARRHVTGDGAELLVSLRITREEGGDGRINVPLQFEIAGARSETAIEMTGPHYDLKDYRIPLDKTRERGWGKVSIPADANRADNEFYFAFGPPVARRTLIVTEDPQASRPLQLAAEVTPEPGLTCTAEIVDLGQLSSVDWSIVSLVLWQAPLPEEEEAERLRALVARGGQVIFFPPKTPGNATTFGVHWTSWRDDPNQAAVENWRGDQDLLMHTNSGAALPVGQIKVRRICAAEGTATPLATLRGGATLLSRVATDLGGVYFCSTTAAPSDSSLATDGVVFYVMIQRALRAGTGSLEKNRDVSAGLPQSDNPEQWKRLAGASEAISTEYALHRGVYESGDKVLAVNRPAAEDAAPVVSDDRVASLFRGLDFSRVDDKAGGAGSLIHEIWRMFLIFMIIAMIMEAALCLPRRQNQASPISAPMRRESVVA